MPSEAPTPERTAIDALDVAAVGRWAVLLRGALASHRAEIDALNIFPVPDGDTGTNLYLTFDAALHEVRTQLDHDAEPPTLSRVADALAHAMLFTARGNSGVILSQVFRGLADEIRDTAVEVVDGPALARVLRRADQLAWACVTRPVEGTILSVTRAAADAAATTVASGDVGLESVVVAAARAGRQALARTPSQLPQLARAGVVDAGGAGCVVMLDTLERVVAGRPGSGLDEGLLGRHTGWSQSPVPTLLPPADHATAGGPEYEVMYLLTETDDARLATLRQQLDELGDSVLVIGSGDTWNVHVHVDDAGAAIEAGMAAGRPHRIRIDHLGAAGAHHGDVPPVAVVACAAGEGLADVFRAAGAHVVPSGPGRRASAGHLLDAARATGAAAVILLPNDKDTVMAAQSAARAAADEGIEARVVPARTAVQGIAALAVFDAEAGLAAASEAMEAAAEATRHGAVTVAHKDALTAAGWCHTGDVLGIVDGDFVVVGSDLAQVAGQVVERLLAGGGELLTVITGADAPEDLATTVAAAARIRRRDIEVTHIAGNQPLYPLLLGVE